MISETSCSVLFSYKIRKLPLLNEQPIGTLSLWNDLWLAKVFSHGLDFFKAWKQSHEEVQESSYLSEHLNYNMLKGYYGLFAQWCQKHSAYSRFNSTLKKMWEEVALISRGGTIFFFTCPLSNVTSQVGVISLLYWRGQSCFVVLLSSQNAVTEPDTESLMNEWSNQWRSEKRTL